MKLYSDQTVELESLTESFFRDLIEKLSPTVQDCVKKKSAGHFEIHYAHGKFQLARHISNL